MIDSNWSVRAEYLYYSFDGGPTATAPLVQTGLVDPTTAGSTATYRFGDLNIHVARVAVNYKF